jgi:16S rRNA (uracil1498-N3)-methyltransferase
LQSVNAKKICAVIGCEGGFSPEEAEAARAAGFRMANLGPRILRCETAPNYVLSAISYHFEL